MTVDLLISKLDKVRPTGRGTWIACCPAHADKSPSLTIRETDDEIILLHCFAGCSALEIVDAVGLEMADLFPPRQHHGKPERRPFPAADVLRALASEALVVASVGVSMLSGRFTDADRERLILAVSRIQSGIAAAGVAHGR
jgi:hypothetical protein